MIKKPIINSILFFIICSLTFLPQSFSQIEKPSSITLGHEDQISFPWVFPKEKNTYTGVDLIFVQLLSKELSVPIKTIAFPWTRTLSTMEAGDIDGAFAASYKKVRERQGQYPTINGERDTSKRMHMSGYSLYINNCCSLDFDGTIFTRLKHKSAATDIGVQKSFSIIDALEKLNLPIFSQTSDPKKLLSLLSHKRLFAVTIQSATADHIIANNDSLKNVIVKHPTTRKPFHQKPYYIMLSHQFVDKYPEFTLEFWNAVEKVRTSEEYTIKFDEFLNQQ